MFKSSRSLKKYLKASCEGLMLVILSFALISCKSKANEENSAIVKPVYGSPADSRSIDSGNMQEMTQNRCPIDDGYISFQMPDSIWLTFPRGMALDTSAANSFVDTLSEIEFFKLADTRIGQIYFTYGLSDDPEFYVLDSNSDSKKDVSVFSLAKYSIKGTELRLINDSTIEACGIANSYTNHSRTYAIINDSIKFVSAKQLTPAMPRKTLFDLRLFADSLFYTAGCTIPKGTTVFVTKGLLHPDEMFYGETGEYFLTSLQCEGWYSIGGDRSNGFKTPITGLYFHGD